MSMHVFCEVLQVRHAFVPQCTNVTLRDLTSDLTLPVPAAWCADEEPLAILKRKWNGMIDQSSLGNRSSYERVSGAQINFFLLFRS